MVDKVFPGQPIKASTINGVIDMAAGQRRQGVPRLFYYPKEILVKNTTQDVWSACTPIGIIEADALTETLEFAISKYLTYGAIILGGAIDSNTPVFRIGLTKESIQPDCLGKCSVPGLMAAKVNVTDWSHKYVKYDTTNHYLVSTNDSAEAQFGRICGVSMRSLGIALCFIAPISVSASPDYPSGSALTSVGYNYYVPSLSWNPANSDGSVVVSESTYSLGFDNNSGLEVVTDVTCDEYGEMHVTKTRIRLTKTNGTTSAVSLSSSVVNNPGQNVYPVCQVSTTTGTFLKPTE